MGIEPSAFEARSMTSRLSSLSFVAMVVVGACAPPLIRRSAPARPPAAPVRAPAAPDPAGAAPGAEPAPKAPEPPAVRLKAALLPGALSSIAWSRDARSIATWCGASCRWGAEYKRRVVVFSLPRLSVEADFSPNKDDMGDGKIHGVGFAPDGSRLATSTHNEVQLFGGDGWKLVTRIGMAAVYGAWQFSPDSRHLAASDSYGHGILVETAGGAKKKDFQLHNGAASYSASVAWSDDGAWTAIEGNNHVRLADVRGASIKLSSKVIDGQTEEASGMALSHDGKWLALADIRCRVELWSTAGPALRKVLDKGLGNPDEYAGCGVRFSPQHDRLATQHPGGSIRVWELSGGSGDVAAQEVRPRRSGAKSPSPMVLSWSADGRYLAWADDADLSLGIWDAQGGSGASGLAAEGRAGQATLRWSPVGHWLARSDGRGVELWDIDARRVRHRLRVAVADATGLLFSPDAAVLAAADGDLHFLRVADGATLTLRSLGIAKSRRSLRVTSAGGFDGDAERAKQDIERADGSTPTDADLSANDAELGARFFAGK
jgi:WD40 repeat protein